MTKIKSIKLLDGTIYSIVDEIKVDRIQETDRTFVVHRPDRKSPTVPNVTIKRTIVVYKDKILSVDYEQHVASK